MKTQSVSLFPLLDYHSWVIAQKASDLGANFIRHFYYICRSFSIVKRLFQFFFEFQLFNSPNLKKYEAFAQLMQDALYLLVQVRSFSIVISRRSLPACLRAL